MTQTLISSSPSLLPLLPPLLLHLFLRYFLPSLLPLRLSLFRLILILPRVLMVPPFGLIPSSHLPGLPGRPAAFAASFSRPNKSLVSLVFSFLVGGGGGNGLRRISKRP